MLLLLAGACCGCLHAVVACMLWLLACCGCLQLPAHLRLCLSFPSGNISSSRVHAGLYGTGHMLMLLPVVGLPQPEPRSHPPRPPYCGTPYTPCTVAGACLLPTPVLHMQLHLVLLAARDRSGNTGVCEAYTGKFDSLWSTKAVSLVGTSDILWRISCATLVLTFNSMGTRIACRLS